MARLYRLVVGGKIRSDEGTRRVYKVIIIQALISAFIGFCLAAAIGWTIVQATADTALPVIITPAMILMLLVLTVFMSVLSAVLAIMKVMRIDPVMVLTR